MRRYASIGSVRGWCGHYHRTPRRAIDCTERDHRACSALGGGAYSDREIVAVEADRPRDLPSWPEPSWREELTDAEMAECVGHDMR